MLALAVALPFPAMGEPAVLPDGTSGFRIDYDRKPELPRLPVIPRTRAAPDLPATHQVAWPPRGPLTVDDAVSVAIQRSPSIRAHIAEVEARIAHVFETSSGARPQVQLQYTVTRFQQPLGAPFTTSIFGNNVTIQAAPFTLSQFEDRLRLTQLVSDGGRTRQLVIRDIASARAAFADVIATVCQTRYDVRTAYTTVLEAEAMVGVARDALAAASEHLQMTRAQYRVGNVARADITFSTTPVTRARITLQSARTQVGRALAHFNALVGADPSCAIELSPTVSIPEAGTDLGSLRRIALGQRADLQALHHETLASSSAAEAAKKGRSINVLAGAEVREIGYKTRELLPTHPGWNLGLEFSYPLMDGGLTSAQTRETRARLQAAAQHEEARAREIDEQVVAAWLTLSDDRQRLEMALAEVRQADEALGVSRGQYQVGVGTNLQVLDAQVALHRARTEEVSARFAVQRSLARLLLVTGR